MSKVAIIGNASGTGTFTIEAPSANSDFTLTLPSSSGTIATAETAGFESGTVMMFVQTAAPTGWTKSTSHDNKALRVVSGTASSGGSVAFTTAFGTPAVSGSISLSGTVGATTLTVDQIPSHTHGGPTGDQSWSGGGGWNWWGPNNGGQQTQARGGSGSHTHSFSGSGSLSSATAAINVQYVDAIIAVKD